jgi:hypothetical protein
MRDAGGTKRVDSWRYGLPPVLSRECPSMRRSSKSVAAWASALAKAQAELINREKSLTRPIRTGEGERSLRYAPPSSGLGILRQMLGQHELATVQRICYRPSGWNGQI